MTDTEKSLIAAIHANPADDAPRLIYADYVHENGDEDKAAFIRLSCQLAREDADDAASKRLGTNPLRGQIRDMLCRRPYWFPICPACRGAGGRQVADYPGSGNIRWEECPHCEGTGHIGGFDRGLVCVLRVWFEWVLTPRHVCPADKADLPSHEPTPWAKNTLAKYPTIRSMPLNGRWPYTGTTRRWKGAAWFNNDREEKHPDTMGACELHPALFKRLRWYNEASTIPRWKHYDTVEQAVDALGEAVVDMIRHPHVEYKWISRDQYAAGWDSNQNGETVHHDYTEADVICQTTGGPILVRHVLPSTDD